MRAHDELDALALAERRGDVRAEGRDVCASLAAAVVRAARHLGVRVARVAPERLQHAARGRVAAVDGGRVIDLAQRPRRGAELREPPRAVADSAVEHEHRAVADERGDGQPLERVVDGLRTAGRSFNSTS